MEGGTRVSETHQDPEYTQRGESIHKEGKAYPHEPTKMLKDSNISPECNDIGISCDVTNALDGW